MINIDWRQFFIDYSIFGFYIRCGAVPDAPGRAPGAPEKFRYANPRKIFNRISWTHLYLKGMGPRPWHGCYKL